MPQHFSDTLLNFLFDSINLVENKEIKQKIIDFKNVLDIQSPRFRTEPYTPWYRIINFFSLYSHKSIQEFVEYKEFEEELQELEKAVFPALVELKGTPCSYRTENFLTKKSSDILKGLIIRELNLTK